MGRMRGKGLQDLFFPSQYRQETRQGRKEQEERKRQQGPASDRGEEAGYLRCHPRRNFRYVSVQKFIRLVCFRSQYAGKRCKP